MIYEGMAVMALYNGPHYTCLSGWCPEAYTPLNDIGQKMELGQWDGIGYREIVPMIGLVAVFVLAQDFWWWKEGEVWAFGLPIWVWWAAALSVVQTLIMRKMVENLAAR